MVIFRLYLSILSRSTSTNIIQTQKNANVLVPALYTPHVLHPCWQKQTNIQNKDKETRKKSKLHTHPHYTRRKHAKGD